MTDAQIQSHEEQMDALRADFARHWSFHEYHLSKIGFTARQLFWARRAAWLVFFSSYRERTK